MWSIRTTLATRLRAHFTDLINAVSFSLRAFSAMANDLAGKAAESTAAAHQKAIVITECFFVNVAGQMECSTWSDALSPIISGLSKWCGGNVSQTHSLTTIPLGHGFGMTCTVFSLALEYFGAQNCRLFDKPK